MCNRFIGFVYFKCQNQFSLGIWNPIWKEHNLGSLCAPINILKGCKLQKKMAQEIIVDILYMHEQVSRAQAICMVYTLDTSYEFSIQSVFPSAIFHQQPFNWKLEHYRRLIAYCHYLIFVLWPASKGLWKPAIFLLGNRYSQNHQPQAYIKQDLNHIYLPPENQKHSDYVSRIKN